MITKFIVKEVICPRCNGTGEKGDIYCPVICSKCDGKGIIILKTVEEIRITNDKTS